MGYQINALFEDGSVMVSGVIKAPTPPLNTAFEVLRGSQPVQGNIVKIRPLRMASLHGPAITIDEIHFREVVAETPPAPAEAFPWLSRVIQLKSLFGARAKIPARVNLA